MFKFSKIICFVCGIIFLLGCGHSSIEQGNQIQRDLLGLSLGSSTKSEVQKILKEKGYGLSEEKEDRIKAMGDIQHENIIWYSASFYFTQDTLSAVVFTCFDDEKKVFEDLNTAFSDRYGEFLIKDESKDKMKIYRDDNTQLELNIQEDDKDDTNEPEVEYEGDIVYLSYYDNNSL
jgi:hypothetical protein